MTQSQVHILVVDDERNIRNNLTMVLEAAGYKVDASGDGEDALGKCKERHYDIAFVDIQMPKMEVSNCSATSKHSGQEWLSSY